MREYKGTVKEIFIPDKDVINSKFIGFKILIADKLYKLILLQDDNNTKLLREDNVKLVIENINEKQIVTIERSEDNE